MKALAAVALFVAGLQTVTTKGKTTSLRVEPRLDAPVVASVPQGTVLEIVGAAEDPYLEVEYAGRTAFVQRDAIDMALVSESSHDGEAQAAGALPAEEMPRFSKVGNYTHIRGQPTGGSKSLARLDDPGW